MARSIGSVTLSVGQVSIPSKLYSAHEKRQISFHRLERKTGARVKMPTVSSVDGRPLAADEMISGYEYTPGQYVVFEADELRAMEAEAEPDRVRIVGVVPADTVDSTHVTRSVFVGPDKGGERAYHLLASMLAHRAEVAVGQWGGRTRDELVILAPHTSGEGLVLHECLYSDEVRLGTLQEAVPPGVVLSPLELELAGKLLDVLARPTFRGAIETLADGGAARVKGAVDRKVEGKEIVVPPPREDTGPLDLVEQLRASVPATATKGPKKARAAAPASAPATRSRRKAG